MNTIYRASQNYIPYTAPPDYNRFVGNRRAGPAYNKNKLSFKSYPPGPPGENDRKSVVDLVTETILVTVFDFKNSDDLRERLNREEVKLQMMERQINREPGPQRQLNQSA